MNMSQMVVGSDDNIEVIPDEDYTIENEEKPQIVINATDGEDGKAGEEGEIGENGKKGTAGESGEYGSNGENGENGENGDNGNPGSRGSSGAQGNPGNSAPNANVIFEPEVMPIFSNLTLETKPYGVSDNLTLRYDSNTCIVTDAWVSIVDVNSGNEVWKKNVFSILPPDKNSPFKEEIKCDTLQASTQYRFNVYATYSTSNYPTQKLSQIMTQEIFYTDSYGFSLTKQAITSNSIELNLNKDKDSTVKFLRVKLFDENMNEIGYFDPVDISQHPVDTTHSFEVDDTYLETGNSIAVKASGLNSDTVYYAQIQIMLLENETGSEPTIVPTNSYPKQKYLTKKVDPILAKPTTRLDEITQSFIIVPGNVIDKDNGITGYRLEIYENRDYGIEGVTPYYTYNVETPILTNISVPITDKVGDMTKLHRKVEYCAHIVALFNNNEETIDFRSPVSDNFIAGEGNWPAVEFKPNPNYTTASTIEGKIVIKDTSGHAFPDNSLISIEYQINDTDSSDVDNDTGIVTEFKEKAIPISQFDHEEFEYSYPISLKSLRDNSEYKLTVKSSEFYIDGIRQGSSEIFANVGSTSIKTKDKYSPLLIKEHDIRSTNPDYTTSMFAINLQFAPININNEETLRTYSNSIVPGLGNMGDVSGRSMTYLQLDLYVGIGEEPDRPITHLKTVHIQDCNNFKKDGAPYKPKYGESTDGLTPILGESEYGYKYAFNTSFYEDAYCDRLNDTKTRTGKDLSLVLTDTIFTDPSTGYNPVRDTDTYKAGTQFFIKVTAYDYTYGLGENYNINGANRNKIKVGDQINDDTYIADSDYDSWVTFYSSYAVPAIPQTYPYCENYLRLGTSSNNIKAQLISDPTYYEDPSDTKTTNIHLSNLQNAVKDSTKTNKETLEALFASEGIADTTSVGITYCGPSTGKDSLAQYCSSLVPSVCYNIYKLVWNAGTSTYDEVLVNTSGFMNYAYTATPPNNVMPTYTFFYDVVDKTTGKSISRGDKYLIETQLILKGNEYHDEGGVKTLSIYPNYWHQKGTLPGDDNINVHTYRVFDNLRSNRQVPSILSMPYNANVNNETENSDEIYLIVNDPDYALDALPREDGDTFEKVKIYKGEFGADGKPIEATIANFGTVSELRGITSTDKVSVVKGNALAIGNLFSKYSLNEEDDRALKYSYIKLMSEENVTKAKTITMIDTKTIADTGPSVPTEGIKLNGTEFKDFDYEWDGSHVNINFKYRTVNPEDREAYKDLLGADVIFTKYVYDPTCTAIDKTTCELVPTTGENSALTIFTTPTYDNWESEQVEPEGGGEKITVYTQKSKIKIDAIDIANIIEDSDAIGIKLALYYDSGDYGIRFFDSSITDKTSDYYLIQYANNDGKAIIPGTTHIYPENYYEMTKKKGVASITDTKIKDISTPLFTRNEVTYTLNDSKISSGSKNFTITPVGLSGAIVKNVGSDVSNELVTQISYIMPTVIQTGIKTGYSTAILDFKVLSADTVLKVGTNLEIKYKKHSESDYPGSNVLEVPYTPSTLDDNNDRNWKDVTITGLTHDASTTSTQYDYEIWGYANDGTTTGRHVPMYQGTFTVQHYKHLDGNLKVETYIEGGASAKTRNTKRLSYILNFENIISDDIRSSLNSVSVKIYDGDPSVDTSNVVATNDIGINTIFPTSGQYYPTYSYDVKIPWAPKSNGDHEMVSGKKYWIEVEYNYKSAPDLDEPYKKEYFSLGDQASSSITGWRSFYNLKSYVVTGQKQVVVIDTGTTTRPDYQLKFNIAGKDSHRLQSIASDSKLTFLVELCDEDGHVVQIKDGSVVATGGEYQRRLITGVQIDNQGSFTTRGMNGTDADGNPIDNPLLTFGGLKANSLYHLNVYFVLDGQNIDMSEIINQLNLSETDIDGKQNIKKLETITGLDIITEGSGVYKIQSIDIRTETNQDLRIDSAILHPESNEAFIIGTNMNFVKRIQYKVTKNGEDLPVVRITGTSVPEKFRPEQYSSDLYYLTIPELQQDGASYVVRIDFYATDGDDWAHPATTAQGIHGVDS